MGFQETILFYMYSIQMLLGLVSYLKDGCFLFNFPGKLLCIFFLQFLNLLMRCMLEVNCQASLLLMTACIFCYSVISLSLSILNTGAENCVVRLNCEWIKN